MMINRLAHYAALLRFNKPVGIFLALWPSLWALWIANRGMPPPMLLFIIILGAIVVRSAGCAINDILDREMDSHVERTRSRPLASKKITVIEAMTLFILLGITALVLVSLLNLLSITIAVITALLTMLYPLAKRYTHFPQCVLGIVFNSGVLIAFAASLNQLPKVAWLLYFSTILWTVAYDTMYAMADRIDDLAIGIRSTAILFEKYDCLIIGILQTSFFIILLIVGLLIKPQFYYYLGLLVALFFSLYQRRLIRTRERTQCFNAFLNNHWIGFIIFIGIVLSM